MCSKKGSEILFQHYESLCQHTIWSMHILIGKAPSFVLYFCTFLEHKTAVIPAVRRARKFCWMALCKLLLIQKPFVLPVIKSDLVILQNIHFSAKRTDRTFKGEKILSTPSFGGEVKPSVPCRRFAAVKDP